MAWYTTKKSSNTYKLVKFAQNKTMSTFNITIEPTSNPAIKKFQANSLLSVTIRSSAIYLFTDYMNFSYTYIFWLSFIVVTTNSYFIQKKFVFKSVKNNSFLRYMIVTVSLAILEYLISNYFRDILSLNVSAFLVAGFFIFLLRFILNKKYVF